MILSFAASSSSGPGFGVVATIAIVVVASVVSVVVVAVRRWRRARDLIPYTSPPAIRDVTDPSEGGVQKYVAFMGRSLPRKEAELLAENLLAHIRFHTAYLSYDPVPARVQFEMPNGAMFVMQDSLDGTQRRLDFIHAQGFVQFQSTNTFRRPEHESQTGAWFTTPATDRKLRRTMLLLQGMIDTTHNAAKAQREPGIPLIKLTTAPARINDRT